MGSNNFIVHINGINTEIAILPISWVTRKYNCDADKKRGGIVEDENHSVCLVLILTEYFCYPTCTVDSPKQLFCLCDKQARNRCIYEQCFVTYRYLLLAAAAGAENTRLDNR